MPRMTKLVCAICSSESEVFEEDRGPSLQITRVWTPYAYYHGIEMGPICPKHNVVYLGDGEYDVIPESTT